VAERAAAAQLARYYDLDLLDDPEDLSLYEALAARANGGILELAVGSGRLAIPLARAGYEVTGIDRDTAMLARARAAWSSARPPHASPTGASPTNATPTSATRRTTRRRRTSTGELRLVQADITDVRLDGRFGLVMLALNSLLLLADEGAQAAALETMAAHLATDGLAVVDVFLPDAGDLALYDGRLLLDWTRHDPETGDLVTKLSSGRHDAATGMITLTSLFDAVPAAGGPLRRVQRTDRMRLVSASELTRLAADAGMQVEVLAGDHQLTPFGPGAERAVLLARSL